MPTFLWSGKDAEGRERNDRIDAENAQAAKALLLNRGWTDLELIKDALSYSEAIHVKSSRQVDPDLAAKFRSPDAEASFFKSGWKTSLLGRTLSAMKGSYKLILVSAALIGLGIYAHEPGAVVVGALGLVTFVLLLPIIHVIYHLFGHVRGDFDRMNKAKVWGRWEEVLECVKRLKKPDRMTGTVLPELALVSSRAYALAKLGRINEALAEYSQLENSPKLERWIYLSFLGAIYEADQQFEKNLELRRQVAELNGQSSMVWIDLAYHCVRRLSRTAEAREALARAEQLEITYLGKSYPPFVRGMIHWREHAPIEAREELEDALAGFRLLAGKPLVEGLVLTVKSFLCATYVDLGEAKKAQKLFREVEPFLVAHHDEELLNYCRGANRPATA